MKYVLPLILFIVSSSIPAAPTLQWDGSVGAEGYNVYCGETPVGTLPPVDSGPDTTHDLEGSVVPGEEYECWVTAYAAGLAESGHSNHITFTVEEPVPMLPAPGNLQVIGGVLRDPGLIAEYKFEVGGQAVVDSSGNGFDGVLVGAERTPNGKEGGGVIFDGVSSRVDLGTFDALSGSEISIAAWVSPSSFNTSDARIISKANGEQSADHYWMISTIGGSGVRFRLKTQGVTSTLVSLTGVLVLNTWQRVVATYDGALMRLFVDGAEVASMPKTGELDTSNIVPVEIGAQPGSGYVFDGVIDEVRLYNRVLSGPEL